MSRMIGQSFYPSKPLEELGYSENATDLAVECARKDENRLDISTQAKHAPTTPDARAVEQPESILPIGVAPGCRTPLPPTHGDVVQSISDLDAVALP